MHLSPAAIGTIIRWGLQLDNKVSDEEALEQWQSGDADGDNDGDTGDEHGSDEKSDACDSSEREPKFAFFHNVRESFPTVTSFSRTLQSFNRKFNDSAYLSRLAAQMKLFEAEIEKAIDRIDAPAFQPLVKRVKK